MPRYRYRAVDQNEQEFVGVRRARTEPRLETWLHGRGCKLIEAVPLPSRRAFRESTSLELLRRLGELAADGIPWADGLRAAAEEFPDDRTRRYWIGVAKGLEQGRPLDDVMRGEASSQSNALMTILTAGMELGRPADLLAVLVRRREHAREVVRSIRPVLVYSLSILAIAVILTGLILVMIIDDFSVIYQELEVTLPHNSAVLFAVGRWLGWFLIASTLVLGLTLLTGTLWLGRARFRRLVSAVPLAGPMVYWLGQADWFYWAGSLLRENATLPQALEWSAVLTDDPSIQEVAEPLASVASTGKPLAQVLQSAPRFSKALVPLIDWGERTGSLPEALLCCSEWLDDRVNGRAAWLRLTLPPLVFTAIATMTVIVIWGTMLPMVQLLESLS